MPFVAKCECGLEITGDAQTNSHLLGKKVIHLDLDQQHIGEIQTFAIQLQGKAPDTGLPCHPSEASVVWRHPGTGDVKYTARNDVPIPERYRRQGYERHEMRNLRALDKLGREKGVLSERAHFDRGSGHSFDHDGQR